MKNQRMKTLNTPAGKVFLIGAGPGDPELLTIKAARVLGECDVLLVDDLADSAVLAHARPDARIVRVGKRGGCRSTPQAFIERLMRRYARAGFTVGRVKGGDPFVFGRGGEELAALHAAGVPVSVVPGISAAMGCAAAVGLSLTERDQRRSLTLLTGHASDGSAEHDWASLARPGQMLAIYMGVGATGHIQERLLEAGIDPDTPVTVVENGTLPQQKLAATTIGCLAEGLIDASIRGPAMIFVGAHPQGVCTVDATATLRMHAIEPGATRCAPERWELAA